MGNIETVQQIYEAFARGDVAAILDKLDEAVEWEYYTYRADGTVESVIFAKWNFSTGAAI